jgi:hypothetical protein
MLLHYPLITSRCMLCVAVLCAWIMQGCWQAGNITGSCMSNTQHLAITCMSQEAKLEAIAAGAPAALVAVLLGLPAAAAAGGSGDGNNAMEGQVSSDETVLAKQQRLCCNALEALAHLHQGRTAIVVTAGLPALTAALATVPAAAASALKACGIGLSTFMP